VPLVKKMKSNEELKSIPNREPSTHMNTSSSSPHHGPPLLPIPDESGKSNCLLSSPDIGEQSHTNLSSKLTPNRENSHIQYRKRIDPTALDEALFTEGLTALAEGLDLELNFKPSLCGKLVPLFQLWQVVMSEGGYGEVEGRGLWPQVARNLNFNDFKHPEAPNLIAACYREILADFETVMADPNLTESQENDTERLEEEQEIPEENEENEENDNLEIQSSSPRHLIASSSNKRSFGPHQTNYHGSPTRHAPTINKRQRIEHMKGKDIEREIPSTPEHVFKNIPSRRPSYHYSPSISPLYGNVDGNSEHFLGPIKKPNFLTSQRTQRIAHIEPKTQDFHFIPPVDEELERLDHGPSPDERTSNDYITHSNLREDSSTQSQDLDQLDAYIDHHQALGYSKEVVVEALNATTIDIEHAAWVMEELTKGRGIPDNIQGVWTREDDEALEDVESIEFNLIMEKHGTKRVITRQNFLTEQREARRERELSNG
jgi:hypothetical protein